MIKRQAIIFTSLLFTCMLCQAQYSILGKVKNANGEKLQGASVFVVGSESLATVTDYAGRYLLENVPAGDVTVKVTYLGYGDETYSLILEQNELLDINMQQSLFQLENIEVVANKLDKRSPYAYTEMDRESIQFKNMAQDVPFLLEHAPSMVITSDAGAGIGYTGMRIRGSDATRVNVTINGIPLNDSESHGVFWVDLPDFGSSVDRIQIQRGVGPSTNGSGAFGGSVSLNTNYISQNPFVRGDFTVGSFGTQKQSVTVNTGLMNNQFNIEGRYSRINSDGFIDRATSDLDSWYLSAASVTEKTSIKINAFSGNERTYQAWNGVPEARFNGDEEALLIHFLNNSNGDYNTVQDSINLFSSNESFNAYTYENQVDSYRQTHLQLFVNSQLSELVKLNLTGHYTKGKGFFEQFRFQEDVGNIFPAEASLQGVVSDLVWRRWLDNDFFGAIANIEYKPNNDLALILGAAYNSYLGDHFGNVINIEEAILPEEPEYYRSDATKNEFNSYMKADYQLLPKLSVFGDLQFRSISYKTAGLDSDQSLIAGRDSGIDTSYTFVNPKVGLSFDLTPHSKLYASYAAAQREPVRSDFLDAIGTTVPEAEQLHDFEFGYRAEKPDHTFEANFYYMLYNDQLVLTGAVNDVGAPVRTNVDNSVRFGVELSGSLLLAELLTWEPNVTFSRNRISEFVEKIADFDNGGVQETLFTDTDIAFSPSVIAGSKFTYHILPNFDASLLSKYVGRQFLDNTSNENRSLDPYFVNDFHLRYKIETELVQEIEFKLLVNNIFNTRYASNGYTYSYIFGGLITENYLYPQAGTNFLLSASVMF